MYLVPETTILKWVFGETTISYVKNWNHPIETTTDKWMFEVPGMDMLIHWRVMETGESSVRLLYMTRWVHPIRFHVVNRFFCCNKEL